MNPISPLALVPIEPLETRIAPAFAASLPLGALDGTNGFKINGVGDGDHTGYSSSAAGDINGDGIDDLLITSYLADLGAQDSGAAFVVFGKSGGFGKSIDLATLDGTNGFALVGAGDHDYAGILAGAAGDVNGDGFGDLIVGASNASVGAARAGAAYVVFGKAGGFPAVLNLGDLNGTNGFKLSGVADGDRAGDSVAGAGDVNGDGFADVIVGANGAHEGGSLRGAAYVVFGKPGGFAAELSLGALDGTNGFKLPGINDGDQIGDSVSGAGDVNGDGFADFLVDAENASEGGVFRGALYVVFGKAGGFNASISLAGLDGTNGFKLSGIADGDRAGDSVRAAGDVNGDGFADVILGSEFAREGGLDRGAAYVVFGKAGGFAAALNLSALDGTNGFKISGIADADRAGASASGAGDVNGDGFADLIVGAYAADEGGINRGAAYVVFGKAGGFGASVPLSGLNGTNGFKLSGEANYDYAGYDVNTAGDVNGDGFADLIVAATNADAGGNDRGAAYIVFGHADTKVSFSKDHRSGTFVDTDGDLVTVKLSKGILGPGNFTFSGGVWQKLDLSGNPLLFGGTDVTVSVKKAGGGNGAVNLGALDAHGLDLGKVTFLSGDLGQIDAGDGNFKTPAVKALSVGSLGAATGTQPIDTINPIQSDLAGALGKLTVKGNLRGAINVTGGTGANIGHVTIDQDLDGSAGGLFAGLLRAGGNIGPVLVKGGVIGGADFSGIIAGGKLGMVTIGEGLSSGNVDKPVIISALGKLGATKTAGAVAIAGLSVKANVSNARILAGYTASLGAANPDASIGTILVHGDWSASSVAAGVSDATGDGFGRNDTLIGGDTTPALFAQIASITIKGTATGSVGAGDFFGLTAQRLNKLAIGKTRFKFTNGTLENLSLDESDGDFHAVDFA